MNKPGRGPGRGGICVTTALLCALLGLGLQWLVVGVRYGGNWTALFCTGSQYAVPPALAAEGIYVFPNSGGYDGQMYHYVAHDPLARSEMWRYLDDSRLRYRRILLPAVAFLLAFGDQGRVDAAYLAGNLLFLFLGAWWLSRYIDSLANPGTDLTVPRRRLCAAWTVESVPAFAALFVLAPAALISLDRLTVDLAFTALCIGFALYSRLGQNASAYATLALACLSRETGFMLAAAACLALSFERRFAKAAAMATAAVPAAAWYLYVNSRVPNNSDGSLERLVPFKGIVEAMVDPIAYPFSGIANAGLQWLDRLALLGLLAAVVLSVWLIRRNGFGQLEAAMVLWSLLGLCLPRKVWEDCFAWSRVFTPLLIYVMLRGLDAPLARWKAMAPLLLVLPRVALQIFGPVAAAIFGTVSRP